MKEQPTTPVRDDWEKEFDELAYSTEHFNEYGKPEWAATQDCIKSFFRQLLSSTKASIWKRAIESVPEMPIPKRTETSVEYWQNSSTTQHHAGWNSARSSLLAEAAKDNVVIE